MNAVIIIAKEGKDIHQRNNWRPVSLLNTDYKSLSIILSNRLIVRYQQLLGEAQFGFVKNRYIGNYLRTIADIMDYIKSKHNSRI